MGCPVSNARIRTGKIISVSSKWYRHSRADHSPGAGVRTNKWRDRFSVRLNQRAGVVESTVFTISIGLLGIAQLLFSPVLWRKHDYKFIDVRKSLTVFCSMFVFSAYRRIYSFCRAYICLISSLLEGSMPRGEDWPIS